MGGGNLVSEIGVGSIFFGLNEPTPISAGLNELLLRKYGPELAGWRDKTPRPP